MFWLTLLKIGSRETGLRRNVNNEPVQRHDAAALEVLTEALGDTDEGVRLEAVKAFTVIGGRASIKPLVAVLNDTSERVSSAAANALNTLPADDERDRAGIRIKVAKALANVRGCGAIKLLTSILNDPNEGVSVEAAKAFDMLGWTPSNSYDRALWAIRLGRYDEAARQGHVAVPLLLAELRRINPHVLVSSIQSDTIIAALGKVRGDSAVDCLVPALLDPDESIRIGAAKALGDIGGSRAVEALIATLQRDK
jgi:HEAT repeat protein